MIRFKPVPSTTTTKTTTTTVDTTTTELQSPYFPLITSSSEDGLDDDQHLIKKHHLKHSEDLQKASVLHDLEQLEKGLKERQDVFNVQVSSR